MNPGWLADGLRHVWLPYTQMKTEPPPLPVVAAYGSRLRLADGRELIDGVASWWTAAHGYAHPHILECVRAQLEGVAHVMFGGLANEAAYTLAIRLAALLPGDLERVFFSESGSVSVEIALKMAFGYHRARGAPERTRVLAFERGYHGDTFATMAIGGAPMHGGGGEPASWVVRAPLPVDDASRTICEAVVARNADRLAAIVVEPLVQGAGGMVFHEAAVLRELRALADRSGALLMFDEIFTGFGRTGTLFAADAADVVPDIVTLSKALTGGTLPLAATVARAAVFDAFWSDDPALALMHGPTYMGNALACAAAHASLDLFASEPRLAQVAAIETFLRGELAACRDLPGVRDVRVRGAIGVVQLANIENRAGLTRRFVEHGVWIRPFGDVVYLTPPLTISQDELAALTSAIRAVLADGSGS
ncbi:MAG: adenosylmethionine--8-amino-7-oxononanoate transaminase [Candidatus Velthaea sp.]